MTGITVGEMREYQHLQPCLRRFVRKSFPGLCASDVDDVCQQAWEALYRYRSKGKKVENPLSFLCQGARWAGYRLMRNRRKSQLLSDIDDHSLPLAEGPATELEQELAELRVSDLLQRLPETEREIVASLLAGKNRSTICEQLELTRSDFDRLWGSAQERLLQCGLAAGDSGLREELIKANGRERLTNQVRCLLDRAAASDPALCAELAQALS